MPSALTNFLPPSNFITNGMLQQPCVSGNDIATQSILNGMIAPNSIDVTKLQSATVSGNAIATQSILPGHIIGGLQANRNKIINGDFAIWQRMSGLSFNISNVAATKQNYTADRWSLLCSTGNGIYQVFREERLHPYDQFNQYVRNPFGYTLKVVCSGTDSTASAGQNLTALHTVIENADLAIFGNERAESLSVVASFWIRSSKIGNINVFLRPYFTNGTYYSPQNQIASIIALVPIQAANTWEYKQVCMGNTQLWTNLISQNDPTLYNQNISLSGVGFGITLQCGNPYQSSAGTDGIVPSTNKPIVLGSSSGLSFNTAGDFFYISQVQLEGIPNINPIATTGYLNTSGTFATPFETVPYQQQLAKCQRYCVHYFNQPGNGANAIFQTGFVCNATNAALGSWVLPVPMRTTPSVSCISGNLGAGPSGAFALLSFGDGTLNLPISTFTITKSDGLLNPRVDLVGAGTGLTGGRSIYIFTNSALASLVFNADF